MKWADLNTRQKVHVSLAYVTMILSLGFLVCGILIAEIYESVESSLFYVVLGLLLLMWSRDISTSLALDKLEKQILSLMEAGA